MAAELGELSSKIRVKIESSTLKRESGKVLG